MPIDTPAWVRDAVFYQIFPDRFAASARVPKPGPLEPWDAAPTRHGFKGGDLLGIVERLPYLESIGVTALYLTPIFASASNHRYHTYDYLHVDPLLGGDAALRELLDASHDRGMRVVLDGVFNHTGRGFWPFHHVVENGLDSPYAGWFHLDRDRLAAGRPLDPYPAVVHEVHGGDGGSLTRLGYRAWWDLPALPKLDTNEPAVREYLFGVAEHWLRFGIDGWRLDVPTEIDDGAFWAEFRRRCRAIRGDAYLVGEIWREAPEWLQGDRFDAVMDYPLAEALLGFASGRHLDRAVLDFHEEYRERVRPLTGPEFGQELERILQLYPPEVTAVQLNLIDSHDTPRFLTFSGGDRAALRLALLLLLTLPGVPCIYYGDEIGLEGGPDPDCRRAFPWEEDRWDRELLELTGSLARLRHAVPALRHGTTRVVGASGGAVAIERALDGERLLILANAADDPVDLGVHLGQPHGGRPLAVVPVPGMESSSTPGRLSAEGAATLGLPGRAGAIVRLA